MREIKFRAWRIDDKKMYLPFNLLDELNDTEGHFPQDTVLMQYTGLHDKNGIEIYEGDILRIKAENGKWNILVVKYGIARREMKSGWTVDIPSFYFDLVGADFKAFPIVKNYKGKHDLTMLEVIGDIYSNPELLKED